MPFDLPDRNFFLVKCCGGSDVELQRVVASNQIVDRIYSINTVRSCSQLTDIAVPNYFHFFYKLLSHLKTHIEDGVNFNGLSSHEDYACELYNGRSICHISCSCGEKLPVIYNAEKFHVCDYTFLEFLSRINWAFKYIVDHSVKVQNKRFDIKPLSKKEKEVFQKMAGNPIDYLEVE